MKYNTALVAFLAASTYEAAKAMRAPLTARHDAASAALQEFTKDVPRGPMNLLPDAVSQSPAYRALRQEYAAANIALIAFNGPFIRQFKKEMQAERAAKYPARFPAAGTPADGRKARNARRPF